MINNYQKDFVGKDDVYRNCKISLNFSFCKDLDNKEKPLIKNYATPILKHFKHVSSLSPLAFKASAKKENNSSVISYIGNNSLSSLREYLKIYNPNIKQDDLTSNIYDVYRGDAFRITGVLFRDTIFIMFYDPNHKSRSFDFVL
jgi:hypothetical protein